MKKEEEIGKTERRKRWWNNHMDSSKQREDGDELTATKDIIFTICDDVTVY